MEFRRGCIGPCRREVINDKANRRRSLGESRKAVTRRAEVASLLSRQDPNDAEMPGRRRARPLALWYASGVAAPCRVIAGSPDAVYEHTNRGNTIAIVFDGSRVLGLGDIGPEAGLPVIEGKALPFKLQGGVDAVPLGLRARTPEEIIEGVRLVEPSFGGINPEDIAQPKCFRVLDALQGALGIPVWHDDQQRTGLVVLAGLENALKVVEIVSQAGAARRDLISMAYERRRIRRSSSGCKSSTSVSGPLSGFSD